LWFAALGWVIITTTRAGLDPPSDRRFSFLIPPCRSRKGGKFSRKSDFELFIFALHSFQLALCEL
jgi:hypothetical protein